MSSSASPAPVAFPTAAKPEVRAKEIRPFLYELVPESGIAETGLLSEPAGRSAESVQRETQARAQERAFEREQGREEGRREAAASFADQLARERAAVVAALEEFHGQRGEYFRKIEGEVVVLALSIVRKILHREAQVDPLLLAGMVRVALEKIDGVTKVSLRLNPQNACDWRTYLATHIDPGRMPEIVEDPALPPDRCMLETAMGTAELGVEVQLKEIEQGLMDLLAARPGAAR